MLSGSIKVKLETSERKASLATSQPTAPTPIIKIFSFLRRF
jgi:hypothetical protein